MVMSEGQGRRNGFFSWEGWKGISAFATTITALATTITAVGAVFISYQSLHSTQDQYKLAQQTQITDRFTKAIDALGSDRADVRTGAIFALERLSTDSPADRTTIMDALGAYVRNRASAPPPPPSPPDKGGVPTERNRKEAVHCPGDPEAVMKVDIQAALGVIQRRDPRIADGRPINLSHACLVNTVLSDMRLPDADLTGSDLTNVDFLGVTLFGPTHHSNSVDMRNTHMFFATFKGAVARYGCFQHAELLNADLSNADFSGSDMRQAYMPGSDMRGSNLEGAALEGTDLTDVKLDGANLKDVSYDTATLWPANFPHPPYPPSSRISQEASLACPIATQLPKETKP